MTVQVQVPYNKYVGNGTLTVFNYTFMTLQTGDIKCMVDGVPTPITAVTGIGVSAGGTITLATAPANGAPVYVYRAMVLDRMTDYQDYGDFDADVVNADFDRIWLAIQQYGDDAGYYLARDKNGGPFDAKGFRITNMGTPTDPADATTKAYVDSVASGALANTIRFPYPVPVMPSLPTTANKLVGLNAQGLPVPVSADAGSNTQLSIELADRGNPGGAGMVGWNGVTVADGLSNITGRVLTRLTNYGIGFANWPQGKMFSWKGYAYMGYHGGGLHGSNDADAYILRTRDGVNFSDPFTVATHTATEGAAWFCVGVTAQDTLIGIMRFRAGASDDAPIRHVIYRSSNGSSWVAGETFNMTTASGATPTLYHGFCLLPNGNFITGYHAIDGELGYVEINPLDATYTKHVMLTPAENLNAGAIIHVELNFLRRDDTNKVLITSRSQFASVQPPSMWVLDATTYSLSNRVPTGIPFSVNPVTPVFLPGYQRVMFVCCNRYDSLNLANEQAAIWVYEASLADAFNMNWSGFRAMCVARLSGDLNSNAGVAGVQHACLHGDMILIGTGCEVDCNADRSDVFMFKMDYRPSYTQAQTAFNTSGAHGASKRAQTEFGLWAGVGRLARIRMNGLSLVNDEGSLFQFGFTNLNNGSRGLAFYTGETPTPAIYIRSSGVAGNVVAMDFNRDINFSGGTFHYAPGARIRFNSNTSAVGPSTIYYNPTIDRLEINSTSSPTAAVMYSRSTDILTLSRSDPGSAVNPAGLYLLASNDTAAASITGGGQLGINFNVSGFTSGAALRVAQNGNIIANTPVIKAKYVVASLPTAGLVSGAEAFATNGRQAGQAAGAGTGCPVWYDGTVWRTYYDNSPVAA